MHGAEHNRKCPVVTASGERGYRLTLNTDVPLRSLVIFDKTLIYAFVMGLRHVPAPESRNIEEGVTADPKADGYVMGIESCMCASV
jgi:hypothetical protein